MARNIMAENASVQKAQQTSIYFLGWISLAVAITGGAYAAEAWPGDTIRWIAGLVPWDPFVEVLLFVGFVAWAIDILNDLTPNQSALTFAAVGPSLAVGADGQLADRIGEWTNALQAGVGGEISQLAGNIGAGALSIVCIGAAVLIGKRVLAKQSTAAGRAGGGPR